MSFRVNGHIVPQAQLINQPKNRPVRHFNMRYGIWLAILICGAVEGQNLVPNYSFEDLDPGCPNSLGNMDDVADWFDVTLDANSGSDVFITCGMLSNNHVPDLWPLGFQWPYDGEAFAHFGKSPFENPTVGSFSEGIGVRLIEPLEGKRYCLTLQMGIADNTQYRLERIDVQLSDFDPAVPGYNLEALTSDARLYQTSGDTLGWRTLTTYVNAEEGDEYPVLGNFAPTDQVNFIAQPNDMGAVWAGVFIDAVVLELCEDELEYEIPNVFSPNGDGNLDYWIVETSGVDWIEVVIFSRWGNEVYSYRGQKSDLTG